MKNLNSLGFSQHFANLRNTTQGNMNQGKELHFWSQRDLYLNLSSNTYYLCDLKIMQIISLYLSSFPVKCE